MQLSVFAYDVANSEQDQITLHMKWKHSFQFAGFYAAQQQGFYEDEGLNVSIVEGSPGNQAIEAVLAGRAQYGVWSSAILKDRLEGKPLVVVAVIFQHSPYIILSRRDSGIRRPSDLIGKRVATNSDMGYAQLRAILLHEGIPAREVEVVDSSWDLEDLIEGRVDATLDYITDQPHQLAMRGIDYHIIQPIDYGVDFYGDCIFTSEEEARRNPQRVEAFRRASLLGWRYALDHPDELIDYILTLPGARERGLTKQHLQYEAEKTTELILPKYVELGHMNEGRWEHIADTFVSLGAIPPDYNLDGLLYANNPWRYYRWLYALIGGLFAFIIVSAIAWIWNRQLRQAIIRNTDTLLKTQDELKKSKEAEAEFSQHLTQLYEVTLDLSRTKTEDELLRHAVEMAHSRLHFDRFGIWLAGDPEDYIHGTYGIDEQGKLRDERKHIHYCKDSELWKNILESSPFPIIDEDAPLYDNLGNCVGRGTSINLALCDGDQVFGEVSTDNLLTGKPITSRGLKLLTLYTSAIGHLISRKRAERAMLESKEHLEAIIENEPECVKLVDSNGILLDMNPAGLGMIGATSKDQAIGKSIYDRIDEADRESYKQFNEWICSGHSDAMEYTIIALDGKPHRLSTIASPMKYSNTGEIVHLGIARDVTEQRQNEAERERLTTAIEQVAETIFITDTEGTIQYVNSTFEKVAGYNVTEVVGKNLHAFRSEEYNDAFYHQIWQILVNNEVWSGRINSRRKDGSIYVEEVVISPVRDSKGEITNYVAVNRDITHEARLEEQLRHAQKMEAVGQLAGGIAHDFNNLLQAILGYTQLELSENDGSRNLEQIERAATRAAELTRQLLAFSRKQVIELSHINLNEVIDGLAKMIRRLIGEHIELTVTSAPRLDAIQADPGQIEQVLMNLCVNARDAMPEGGRLTIETENVQLDEAFTLNHPESSPGKYVLMKVSDTGAGMSAQTLEQIFEPFFTTKEVGKGTGLGLAMVYGIIKQHDGYIYASSQEGLGTQFSVYLPATETRPGPRQEIEEDTKALHGSETILVAEDDEAILALTSHILQNAGYQVIQARNGSEAIDKFEQYAEEIEMAIFDVVMPLLGGEKAMAHILELHPGLPHLFVSGYNDSAVHTDFIQREGESLLQKPFLPKQLLAQVRQILDA